MDEYTEKLIAAMQQKGYKVAAKDARLWFEKWQATAADLEQALEYAVHLGNCRWFNGPEEDCTCGLFALMKKYKKEPF